MSDWLVVLSEDNWEVCRRERLLGLGAGGERRLARMAEGDRVWIYINKRHVERQTPRVRRIRAAVRIAGPVRRLDHPPWRSRGHQTFPYARPIQVLRVLDLPGIEVLTQLGFAQGGAWGFRLLHAPLALSESDVEKLETADRDAGRGTR